VLSYMAFKGAATYYYTVSEVLTQKTTLVGQNIRVAGKVGLNSLVKDSSKNTIDFVLLESSDLTKSLHVSYKGSVPDAFKEGNDAVVEGQLLETNIFKASQIIVKCPSKYVPQEQK
jgi:cytochrome c-type biogenesis protein CcmE